MVYSVDKEEKYQIYFYDYKGNTSFTASLNGEVLNAYNYSIYGVILGSIETVQNDYKTLGKYGIISDSSELVYVRARYYAPSIARWTQPDTLRGEISNPLSLNRYALNQGDPVNFVDISGFSRGQVGWNFEGFTNSPVVLVGTVWGGLKSLWAIPVDATNFLGNLFDFSRKGLQIGGGFIYECGGSAITFRASSQQCLGMTEGVSSLLRDCIEDKSACKDEILENYFINPLNEFNNSSNFEKGEVGGAFIIDSIGPGKYVKAFREIKHVFGKSNKAKNNNEHSKTGKADREKLTSLSASTYNSPVTRETASKLLDFSEKVGGHPKKRHVAKSDEFLKNRVENSIKQETITGKIPKPATSFYSENIAKQALRDALNTDIGKKKIKEVIRLSNNKVVGQNGVVDFTIKNISNDLGYGFKAVNGEVVKIQKKLTDVTVALKSDGKGGYYILTVFPK